MPNFAKSSARAAVRTTSLQTQAGTLLNNTEIAPAIQQSMQAQGMWANGVYGPGAPINPTNPVGTEPRQFAYRIGQNVVQQPRSGEEYDFKTIKNILDVYDIAQLAIRVRVGELRSFDWGIVPADEKDTDLYASEIEQVRKFFDKPFGGGSKVFDDLLSPLGYDLWAYDALCMYPHLTRGGKLGALEPIDGTTITPLVDYYGREPVDPAPAYAQWMYGMPWTWLDRNQIIYKPYQRKNNKLYGTPPVEWLMTHVNTDIRHQLYFLQYFTDGNIPAAWINAPENWTPDQIEQYETMYNAVMLGNQSKKRQALMIPFGAKAQMAKDLRFDVPSALFLLTKTCAAWDVTPAELGFTEKVNKSSGETQENVQFRKSIKPTARYFQSIFTGIIHQFFGYTNLYFKFLNLDEQEDLLLMAQRDKIYVEAGVVSPDEIRAERFGYATDAKNPVPRMFITTSLIQTVDDAVKASNAAVAQTVAQTEQIIEQAKQPAADPNAQGNGDQPDEIATNIDPAGEQEAEHPEIEATVEEREAAQKAALDFFF